MITKTFLYLAVFLGAILILILSCIYDKKKEKELEKERKAEREALRKKIIVPIRELTQEEIDEIHANGKLTPNEIVDEWESFGLCAPGDAVGSAALRCHTFKDCHECLVHYAYESLEHTSFKDVVKIVNSGINNS